MKPAETRMLDAITIIYNVGIYTTFRIPKKGAKTYFRKKFFDFQLITIRLQHRYTIALIFSSTSSSGVNGSFLGVSVTPSLGASISPSLEASVTPSLEASVTPSLEASVTPSRLKKFILLIDDSYAGNKYI